MSDLTFDDLRWLHLLWAVMMVTLAASYGLWRRRTMLRRFADSRLLSHLVCAAGMGRGVVRVVLITAALVALVAALVGPRWGEQTQMLRRRNIDLLVVLDVSRSMLARDIAPNRLERARIAIRDDLLPALGGDRIGLVTFAGLATVSCPLTTDYGFFRLALEDASPRSVPRGGTLIGDALRKAASLFERDRVASHKIVLLITDGEDHESFPVEAAGRLWSEHQAPVIAIALGDPEQGARVPLSADDPQTFVEYRGEVVRSRADFDTLARVAAASPYGVFVPAGTADFDLGELYRRVSAAARSAEEQEQRRVQRPARHHPFAVAALVLVLIESLLSETPRRGLQPAWSVRVPRPEAA